ncbi:MAG: phosphomannose isomerase type II C-terminal cupin domain, partial [Porcipelethomonas sp.]
CGNVKGNAVIDDTSNNTNVVNELDIPILCMGCKNMIIAASSDGILVSDKERSGYMKPYVEQITGDAMFAEKSWGTYTVIDVQPGSMTIKADLSAGSRMTYHSHELRSEVWTIVSGTGRVIIDGEERNITSGDVISIPIGVKHCIMAETNLNIIEVQIGQSISKRDKIIFEE